MGKKKFGFLSQSYEAPRAESVEFENEGLLLSASEITGLTNTEEFIIIGGNWSDGSGN